MREGLWEKDYERRIMREEFKLNKNPKSNKYVVYLI